MSQRTRLYDVCFILLAIIVHPDGARAAAADAPAAAPAAAAGDKSDAAPPPHFAPEQHQSHGAVTIGGKRIEYTAYAGTIVVHPKDWDDVPQNRPRDEDKNPQPEASMFYVAYFRSADGAAKSGKGAGKAGADTGAQDDGDPERPVTFLYNGGPGSSTVWLHMGAFGPRRVVTRDDTHTPPAPYGLVNNEYSLLDQSDLVFIDAPGTGFSRIAGKDREKAFYGVDQDAAAFADFVTQFLSKYRRWNSPKYLFGESYGTTRSAVLANLLQTDRFVDLNGVILLSEILSFDNSADSPEFNPGVDLPYELALPTYAATAWYHHKLPDQPQLEPLLAAVEQFATGDYAQALSAGSALGAERKNAIAERLHEYTGLPVAYLLKADLRVNGGEFEQQLQIGSDLTTGRLDTRFSGPSLDPLDKEADYDPQSAAIGSAYVASFNQYVRTDLGYTPDTVFKPEIDIWKTWNFLHQPPGAPVPLAPTNVMPDLATAMKYNPDLHVMLNAGYFDLATPFFEGIYEMQHLPIEESLRKNIELDFYQSGHMVYAHEPSLKELHDRVAEFIRHTQAATHAPAAGGG